MMRNISDQTRRLIAAAAAFFLVTGIGGILLTMGGRYGTSETILEIIGLSEVGGAVFIYSILALVVGFGLGYIVRMNTTDDERTGLE